MSVKLRLFRMGKKKRPFYRIIVVDGRRPRDGTRYLDQIGIYDPGPGSSSSLVRVDAAKALKWLRRGAVPSQTVKQILKKEGILNRLKGKLNLNQSSGGGEDETFD